MKVSRKRARSVRRRCTVLCAVAGMAAAALAAVAAPAFAATLTGTYYVDNSAGSGCSDSFTTTSPSQPWCDFTPLNGNSLGPGSQVLLANGDTWDQPLYLSGSGTSSNWITLGSYGTGARPIIEGNGNASDRTVVLTNVSYWHVQDLQLTNAGEGLLVEYTTLGNVGLDIHDIYAYDINGIFNASPQQTDYPDIQDSAGITISAAGAPTTTSGQTVLSDVSIRDNETYNTSGIFLIDDPANDGLPQSATSTFSGVQIVHNYLHDATAPQLAVEAAENPLVANNYVDCSGEQYAPQGTTCFFVSDVDSAAIQNNVFVNVPDTGSSDETAMDLEYKISDAMVYGNYFGNNAGAGIEMLQLANRPGDYSTGSDIADNTFYDNGGAATSQQGQIAVYNDPGTTPPGATIRDNVYEDSPGGWISNVDGDPDLSNITQSDDLSVSSEYPVGYNFSNTQGYLNWYEQGYSGGGSNWTDLPTYDGTTNQWQGDGDAIVGNFGLQPGSTSNEWVARVWVAPQTGNIAIRGRVFKSTDTGDTVQVLIQQNSSFVWPGSPSTYQTVDGTDQSGYDTNVDLSVTAGDTILFVVYDPSGTDHSGDFTSWTPSISYY